MSGEDEAGSNVDCGDDYLTCLALVASMVKEIVAIFKFVLLDY